MSTAFQSHTIETNGVKLHVMSAGNPHGPLMVFLHGFPEFWYGWKKQLQYFSKQGFWVLAPDQRGYNLSEKPSSVKEYKTEVLAADIIGLLAGSGRKKMYLVGHDWGAAIAWNIAINYPEQIEKLIILNVPHPKVMKKNLFGNFLQMRKSWYIFFFQLPKLPEWFLSRNREQALAASLKATSRPGTFSKGDIEKYREAWQKPGAIKAMLNWYRAGLPKRLKENRGQLVSVPTLIIWGERDQFLGKEMAAQSLEFCSSGRLELIPEGSHWVHHEEPDRVNQLIQGFLPHS